MRADHLTDTGRMNNIRRDVFVLSQYLHPGSNRFWRGCLGMRLMKAKRGKVCGLAPLYEMANAVTAQFTRDTVATFLA
jgi:hypothetical protein